MPTVSAQVTDFYRPGGFDYNGASIKTFSVSANTAVQFSRGNLQYNPSLDKWRFALRQYDYACGDNANIAEDYNGWMDMFAWGTSGWNSGATSYQPWETNSTSSNYQPGGDGGNNLVGTYSKADWGIYNMIENGGKFAGMWRTLTKDEWGYLIGNNAKRGGKNGLATIGGIHKGLLLLPDEWTLPSGCSFTAGHTNGYETNRYTYAEWEKMQAAGAVFLPAAGYRYGADVRNMGENGLYWSTTCYDATSAWYCFFYNTDISRTNMARSNGMSVRLVRRVQTSLVQNGWVDMGLPSGTLWYSCNVGTTKPQGNGTYFAWGETRQKANFEWSTYAYGTGSDALTKYYDVDGLTVLESGDDAAKKALGASARIPTKDEWQELKNNCTGEWTQYNGVNGWMFTSNANGNRLFLPAAANRNGSLDENDDVGVYGFYWSSILHTNYTYRAWCVYFDPSRQDLDECDRFEGLSVRAVKSVDYREWVDLGLPSGTKWYSCNVGATKPWEYGSYFAWGETTSKESYYWSTYRYGTGSNELTKYCTDAEHGLDGYTDTLTYLEAIDDAARAAYGVGARTPTLSDWSELSSYCNEEWTTMNGVVGCKFTSRNNGNSIFLPACGSIGGTDIYGTGVSGSYWIAQLADPVYAREFIVQSSGAGNTGSGRYRGLAVRAVKN